MRYFDKCRCCLEDGELKELWAEYVDDGGTEIYGQMLNECFSFSWQESTDYSEQICESCIKRLRDAMVFRQEAMSAKQILDEIIKQNIAEAKLDSKPIKIEVLEDFQESDVDNEENLDHEQMVQQYMQHEYIEEGETNESLEDEQESQGCVDQEREYVDCSSQSEGQPDDDMQVEYLEDDSEAQTVLSQKRKWPKKRKKGERLKVYKNYTRTDLMNAIEMVLSNKMTRAEAAAQFNVPVKTLGAKLRMKEAAGDSYGDNAKRKQQISTKHYENIRSILLCSNATPIKGRWGLGYTCCFCPKQFQDPNDLKKHNETHDDSAKAEFMKGKDCGEFVVKLDVTNLECKLCSEEMDSLDELTMHLREKHSKIIHEDVPNQIVPFKFDTDVLKCAICGNEFNNFKLLNEHTNNHYRNYECDLCDRAFVNRNNLRMHKYRHLDGEHNCNYCSKVFATKIRKNEHERLVHRFRNHVYKCGHCEERFSDAVAKNKHEISKHGAKLVSFKCKACPAKFTRQSTLTEHVRSFHLLIRPFQCDICEKAYSNKVEFGRHVDSHSGIKRYKCDICSMKFAKPYGLKRHLLNVHGEDGTT